MGQILETPAAGEDDELAWDSTTPESDSASIAARDSDTRTHIPDPTFEPFLLFLYDALSLPMMLKHILDLPDDPVLLPASLPGYVIRMHGIDSALVPDEPLSEGAESQRTVGGAAYLVRRREHRDILVAHEMKENYRIGEVRIRVTLEGSGEEVERRAMAFLWDGDVKELAEEDFDSLLGRIVRELPKH
ncbi:hypothetical protein TWF694_010876 [Orbilia ellipsospora]|uniref:Uncharacterized protein n=1 Tax=Orbilia ellipsospora TaxID=2528407 RepID=A0AAV9X7B4_9PEZI